ncbi:tape measure protein [Oerskovia jenensis]|uniref:tape measure protein n=1 Tax=Oerskovia jenensis TaxID=162169 RepID=UPI0036D9601A
MSTELATAYLSLVPSLKGGAQAISKELGGSVAQGEAEKAGKSIGSKLVGGATKAIGLTTAAVVTLGTAVGALAIKGGISRQLNIEDAQAKLRGLGHDTANVKAIMTDALAAVRGTAFGLDTAATVAASAVAAGIKPGQQLERYLKLTADAATIAGSSMGEMGDIINQVTAKGTAGMENMNRLTERGVPIMQWLAAEYGVSQEALSKMVSAGQVDAATFRKAIEDNIGGAALASGNTTRGAWANMLAAFSRVGVTLTAWFFPLVKTGFNGVTEILDGVNAKVGPWAERFAAWFQAIAGPAVDGFGGRVLGALDRVTAGFKLLVTGDYTSAIRDALNYEEDSRLVGFLLGVRETALAVTNEVGGGVRAMFTAFRDGGTDLTSSGLAGILESIGLVARSVWDALGPTLRDLAPLVMNLATSFSPLGIVLQGMLPHLPILGAALASIGGAVGGVLTAVLPVLAQAFLDIGTALAGAISAVLPTLVPLFEALAAALPSLTPVLVSLVPLVAGLAVSVLQLVAPLLASQPAVYGIAAALGAWKVASLGLAGYRALMLGITAATYGAAGANVVAGTSAKVYGAIMKAQAIGTRVAAAAQWIFNAALSANPIGVVIMAVAALVAGLAWFFTQTEVGKKIVASAWAWIQTAVAGVVGWFNDSVLPVLSAVWDGIKTGLEAAWTVIRVIFVTWATVWSLVWQGMVAVYDAVIKPLWDLLMIGIATAWAWIDQNVFAPMRLGFALIGAAFRAVNDQVIQPVWAALLAGLSAAWAWIDQNVFAPIRLGFALIGAAFRAVNDQVIQPVWAALLAGLSAAWAWINQNVFLPMRMGWELLGIGFRWVKDNVITPAWNGVQTLLQTGWSWIDRNVFAPIKAGVDAVGLAFEATKELIGKAWDKIKGYAATPVNFIIEDVYMGGIKKTWDSIASKVGLDLKLPTVSPIKFASGGVLPGYTPGRDVHQFYSPTGGRLDLSGGEAIMRPEFTRAVGGPAGVARLNALARSRQAFASGGVWGWAGDTWDAVTRGASAAWDWTKDAAGATANFLRDPVKGLLELITKPMNAVLDGIGAGDLGRMVAQVPVKMVGGLVETVKGLVSRKNEAEATAGNWNPAGGGLGWQRMWQLVSGAFPNARLNSAFRPGAITALGTPSMHGAGRAVDLSPSMEIFNWIKANYPNSKEIIYSPAGAGQVYKGKNFLYPEPTKSMHYNHVHWGMANGGVIPNLYDQGGWLPPGRSVVENRTGRPEPVFTGRQFEDLLTSRSGGNTYQIDNVNGDVDELIEELDRRDRRAALRANLRRG